MQVDTGKVAERRGIPLLVVEEAQAGEHRPLVGEVEVGLAVDLVAVEEVAVAREFVEIQPERSDALTVRDVPVRVVGQDAAGPRDARLRDHVVREWCPVALVANSGRHRIENRQGRTGEVSGAHRHRRHLDELRDVGILGSALVAEEVEGLVLLDRAADRAACLVVDELGLGVVAIAEVWIGLHVLVVVVPEARAVHFVGAALDLQVDGGTASQALLGVKRAGDDVDDLDRLQRRVDARHVGQIGVVARRSVDADVVGLVGSAIDRVAHSAGRVRGHRVSVGRGREAR